jgi:hypothetical protein
MMKKPKGWRDARSDVVRVEISRALARDLERLAKFSGNNKRDVVEELIRASIAPAVVEMDQGVSLSADRCASLIRYRQACRIR